MKFLSHGDLDLSGSSVYIVDPVPSADPGFLGLMPQLDDGLIWNLIKIGGLGRAGGFRVACPRKRQVCRVHLKT